MAKTLSGHVVPKVKLLLTKTELESRSSILTFLGRGMFEVLDDSTTFTVNIVEYYCDCMVWDISGITYKHGIRHILRERQDIELYIHEAYTHQVILANL